MGYIYFHEDLPKNCCMAELKISKELNVNYLYLIHCIKVKLRCETPFHTYFGSSGHQLKDKYHLLVKQNLSLSFFSPLSLSLSLSLSLYTVIVILMSKGESSAFFINMSNYWKNILWQASEAFQMSPLLN